VTARVSPPRTLIPPSAPFSPEQRAWLDGFFAAILSADGAPAPLSAADNAALAPASEVTLADNDSAPWHDPSLPIGERMTMAESKPPALRLMAAMAQQDCGQCGYNCADYANALFLKKEERLTLCSPGGKETARMLKQLAAEIGPSVAAPAIIAERPREPAALAEIGASRDNPGEAKFLSRRRLNGAGSSKTTWHVEFDLSAGGLDYVVGDSFGVFARNHPALADQVIGALGANPRREVAGKSLREAMIADVSLGAAPDNLFQLLSYVLGGERRAKARALASGEDPDGDAAVLDVLAALNKFSGVRPGAEAFVEALEPLQPRLYSISSSIKANPARISLTVDGVRYRVGPRERLGVASTFLGERLDPGQTLKVYVQKAHGFRLPDDPKTPIIMVGPGTGVAPFRGFLQEREATGARGKNWLVFGHRHYLHDFLYQLEWQDLLKRGALPRLDVAFSRDQPEKRYVQHALWDARRELYAWVQDGAAIYVCGDANAMAKDVHGSLQRILGEQGKDGAAALDALRREGRYLRDVY
jgi:sulfite reductase (NADPH) flavoprotein alpha-component